jgi:glycerate dehydrogenase
MLMKAIVLDGYTLNPGDNPWDPVAEHVDLTVHERTPDALIVERAVEAEIVLTNKTPLTADTISQLPNLKFVSVLATGFNVVDVAVARAGDIPVSNVPIYGTDTVAQHVFTVLLTHCHNPVLHDQAIRAGQWQATGDFCFWNTPLIELTGKTMGIIGFGRIGRRVGQLANAFGMSILAYDVARANSPDYEPFAWADLEDVFRRSDVVSLHCPQTPENTEMVDSQLLSLMKPDALLINAARGGLIHEESLTQALNEGRIAGAALDVLSREPIADDNPLRQAKNCLLTPHIAWATLEARKRLMAVTAENVSAFVGGSPVHVVN